ncbi:MAG TPA: hydrogenase maturation protease [Candidatus Sulfotelmatobacter sp.]|nr:hydrogenase maturation protease [Candidatus Sulfotelmatobacter sp.]
MARVLIFGYGDPLYRDEGVGWHVADRLAANLSSAEIEVLRLHQLIPETAEVLHGAAAVIFVGAAQDGEPGLIRCEPIEMPLAPVRFFHQFAPAAVLTRAQQLYRTAPKAVSVTLCGQDFEQGEGLSAPVEEAMPELVATVESLARKLLSGELAP